MESMRKIVTGAFLIGLFPVAFAQQAPQFTQFMQSGTILNPAFTGISRNTDVKTGYRKQWIGLQGSPSTFFVSGSAMMGIEEPVLSLPVRGRLASQFRTEKPVLKDTALKHCIGGYLMMDKTGPTSLNRAGVSYAANMPLNDQFRISYGGGLIFSQSALNRSDLNVSPDRDPGISTGTNSVVRPDLQIGIMVYSEKMFFAYSGNYLFRNKMFTLSDANEVYARHHIHHYAFAGYRHELNTDWVFLPSLMIKFVQGSPLGADLNFRFNYKSKAWFGAAFRPQDSFSGFAGFYFNDRMNLAYSYDFNYSKLNSFNSGSHEIILGIRLVKAGEKLFKPGLW
jgi:type IX secretion system PorP/SprF family membrane protein